MVISSRGRVNKKMHVDFTYGHSFDISSEWYLTEFILLCLLGGSRRRPVSQCLQDSEENLSHRG